MSAPINPAIVQEGERLHYALFELRSLCRRWYYRRHVVRPGAVKDKFGRYYMPATEESQLAKSHTAIVQEFVKGAEKRQQLGTRKTQVQRLELVVDIDLSELGEEKTQPVEVRR